MSRTPLKKLGARASTLGPLQRYPRCTGAVYEHAVLLSAEAKDAAEFERHMALLTPYYTDFGFAFPPNPAAMHSAPVEADCCCPRGLIPASDKMFAILGLNLLRLLAQNRIADFHSQLVRPPCCRCSVLLLCF